MKNALRILRRVVKEKGLTQQQIGGVLKQDQTTISKKLAGEIPFQPKDIGYFEEISDGLVTREMLRPDIYSERA